MLHPIPVGSQTDQGLFPVTVLPHREPFVFVDKILEHHPGVSARCEKTFHAHLPFFAGHFPGQPIVPGVLLVEAMAQTAGISAQNPGREARVMLLAGISRMKFHCSVGPGSTVILSAALTKSSSGMLFFDVETTEGDRPVAAGHLILAEKT